MRNKIVIGTRGSKLALWQAEWIKALLNKLYPGLEIELNKIKTTGDKILDVPLAKVGGKGLFVKEIEEALLNNEADIAVHSMKDVPTEFPDNLHLAVITEREDPRDAFLARKTGGGFSVSSLNNLPMGASVGTSSLRRSCQILSLRPDLKIVQLRGNLDTRIRKLDEGEFDAIILASAGVKRLGWQDRITEILEPAVSLPAIGQGAVGIECRIDDDFCNKIIMPLNHPATSVCVRAERALLKRLEGGCQVPIAAYARLTSRLPGDPAIPSLGPDSVLNTMQLSIVMDGLVGSVSGNRIIKGHMQDTVTNAEALGTRLADELLSQGAREILAEVYGQQG